MQESLPRVLTKLLDEGRLLCPATGAALRMQGSVVTSGHYTWNVKNRCLDLYGKYRNEPAKFTDWEFARNVAVALHFREEHLAKVMSAVADTALVADADAYTAEIAELADRLGIDRRDQALDMGCAVENEKARLEIIGQHIAPVLPVAATVRRSVRITNTGPSAINSEGGTPVHMSYHWLDSSNSIVEYEGLRSPLPVDLAPGQSLTVICDIVTPSAPGEYILQLQAVIEGVRWMEEAVLSLPVTVSGAPSTHDVFVRTSVNSSYEDDHRDGIYMVGDLLNTVPGEKRVLEVGGGIHPQSQALVSCDVVSMDISSPMSQLGQLFFDHVELREGIAFIVADAHSPPFRPGTFDAVTIFSALHHFADPVGLLSNLRQVLKTRGFIGVMCEPCEPNRSDEMYIRDLRKGINEQVWTVDEYMEIFRRAGLMVQSGRIDGASMKAILVDAGHPN